MENEISDFNRTPLANRLHIGFFGRRNAGKSSLVNAITGQPTSIVSPTKGTTTDPVKKTMELLPLGPVVLIDTPGTDDTGRTGSLRVQRTFDMMEKTDLAVLVIDAHIGMTEEDFSLIRALRKRNIPFVVALNKADSAETAKDGSAGSCETLGKPETCAPAPATESAEFPQVSVSAKTGQGIDLLKEKLIALGKPVHLGGLLLGDKISAGDLILLVTPIDSAAPKGRLILPQVQTIRDILDSRAVCMVTQPEQLPACLAALNKPPALVVTDSQVFGAVSEMLPKNIRLTSFSILMARLKGILPTAAAGCRALSALRDGNTVLISEGCTHHRQCDDIGTVKLPRWIENFTGKKLKFTFTGGGDFPKDLSSFSLIVHCGGCMLNQREMHYRMALAEEAGVPFTNYGVLIAQIHGILDRSLEIFG